MGLKTVRPETIKLLEENLGSTLFDMLAIFLWISSSKGNKSKTKKKKKKALFFVITVAQEGKLLTK